MVPPSGRVPAQLVGNVLDPCAVDDIEELLEAEV